MDIIIVVLIIAAGLALAFALSSRCPQCRRFLALRWLDSFRDIDRMGVRVRQREVMCKHCKHRLWRNHKDSDASPG